MWKPWWLHNTFILHAWKTSIIWITSKSAASLSSTQATLSHGQNDHWVFGEMNPEKYFLRGLCASRAPQSFSFLKKKTFKWIYTFISLALWLVGLVDSWGFLRACFLLSRCSVHGFFSMVLISLVNTTNLSTTLNVLHFLVKRHDFPIFTLCFSLPVFTINLSKSIYNHATAWVLGCLEIFSIRLISLSPLNWALHSLRA